MLSQGQDISKLDQVYFKYLGTALCLGDSGGGYFVNQTSGTAAVSRYILKVNYFLRPLNEFDSVL